MHTCATSPDAMTTTRSYSTSSALRSPPPSPSFLDQPLVKRAKSNLNAQAPAFTPHTIPRRPRPGILPVLPKSPPRECPEPLPHELDLVIAHDWCMDGFGAVLACRLWHRRRHEEWRKASENAPPGLAPTPEPQEPEYRFMKHRDQERDMPDVRGRHVAIFDYSLPIPLMDKLNGEAASWTLWDHHYTAQQELAQLYPGNCHFDMKRSGAVLAWRYFFGEESSERNLPLWLCYVQDRDLWQWQLPNSRAVSKYFWHQLGRNLDAWELFFQHHPDEATQHIIASTWGAVVLAYEENLLQQICARAWEGRFLGHRAACAITSVLTSEVCERMLRNDPDARVAVVIIPDAHFAGVEGIWRFSVRTRSRRGEAGAEDDVDVSGSEPAHGCPNVGVLCKALGGGGHPCAAGFNLRMDDPRIAELFMPAPRSFASQLSP